MLGGCASAVTYDGVMYGYPHRLRDPYALFPNKALVPTPPRLLRSWLPSAKFNAENPASTAL